MKRRPEPELADSPSWCRCESGSAVCKSRSSANMAAWYMNRRRFLQLSGATAAAFLLPRRARAIGDGSKLQIGQIQLGAGWNPRPSALKRLMWEVDKRTSIDV